jgi:tetratricopeptide (TPR) repeat protein
MKKTVFTTVIFLLTANLAFGQIETLKGAENAIKGSAPNISEARLLINYAIKHPETAQMAKTWFVAGCIENKQFEIEQVNEMLGKEFDEVVMYTALDAILPYFEKCMMYDALPDEKGKVRPKHTKDIKSIMLANRTAYYNAGIYYYNNKDYEKAYKNFKLYCDYREMEIFKGEKRLAETPDSIVHQIRYYAGLSAVFIPNHQAAVEIFEEIKDEEGVSGVDVYRALAGEYLAIKDSTGFEKIITEGFKKFEEDNYFLLNLINLNINRGKSDESITYLYAAIAKDPENANLYDVLGQVYEGIKKTDDAIKYMKKALEKEPDNVEFLSHLGRVYFNLGFEKRNQADRIKNRASSQAENQQALKYFKEAMPYFEKAVAIDATNKALVLALSQIYYSLGMKKEYEKMDAIYNSLE